MSDHPSSSTRPAGTGRPVPPRPRVPEAGEGRGALPVSEKVFGSVDRSSQRLDIPGLDLPGTAVREERPAKNERTDPLAVASLVLGVVALAPVAIVLGVVALVRTKRPGVGGRRLAITGITLGVLWSVAFLAVLVFAVLLGHRVVSSVQDLSNPAAGSTTGEEVAGTTKAASEIEQGECLLGWDAAAVSPDAVPDVVAVDCTTPHRAQAVGVVDLSEAYPETAAYPGVGPLVGTAENACRGQVASSVDPEAAAGLGAAAVVPTTAQWAEGSRDVTCLVVAADPLTSSVTL